MSPVKGSDFANFCLIFNLHLCLAISLEVGCIGLIFQTSSSGFTKRQPTRPTSWALKRETLFCSVIQLPIGKVV